MNDREHEPIINPKILLNHFWNNRKLIFRLGACFLLFGLIVAISIPKEYTCVVKMAPEGSKSSVTGDMTDLAAMAGIDIDVADREGINLTLYPDIVHSTPFLTEILSIKLNDSTIISETLYKYLSSELKQPWWNYVISAPFKLIEIVRYGKAKQNTAFIDPFRLTKSQELVYRGLKRRINIIVDKKTGVINAIVEMQDPLIAAVVADKLVHQLENFIISYRTLKAKQDFLYANKMFTDAKVKYYEAQNKYAAYQDNNKNVILESVLIEKERLKNEQGLAYSVYSGLAQQLEKARMKVQEQTPCVTIIEPARVPVKKSNTSGLVVMFGWCLFGVLIGLVKITFSYWESLQS